MFLCNAEASQAPGLDTRFCRTFSQPDTSFRFYTLMIQSNAYSFCSSIVRIWFWYEDFTIYRQMSETAQLSLLFPRETCKYRNYLIREVQGILPVKPSQPGAFGGGKLPLFFLVVSGVFKVSLSLVMVLLAFISFQKCISSSFSNLMMYSCL